MAKILSQSEIDALLSVTEEDDSPDSLSRHKEADRFSLLPKTLANQVYFHVFMNMIALGECDESMDIDDVNVLKRKIAALRILSNRYLRVICQIRMALDPGEPNDSDVYYSEEGILFLLKQKVTRLRIGNNIRDRLLEGGIETIGDLCLGGSKLHAMQFTHSEIEKIKRVLVGLNLYFVG